jgi:hypothetical protein
MVHSAVLAQAANRSAGISVTGVRQKSHARSLNTPPPRNGGSAGSGRHSLSAAVESRRRRQCMATIATRSAAMDWKLVRAETARGPCKDAADTRYSGSLTTAADAGRLERPAVERGGKLILRRHLRRPPKRRAQPRKRLAHWPFGSALRLAASPQAVGVRTSRRIPWRRGLMRWRRRPRARPIRAPAKVQLRTPPRVVNQAL